MGERPGAVFLVGFMGAGKSTVGKVLARLIGWDFVDLDELIVASESATSASATARRAVGGFAVTSTIRGRPRRSMWVSRRRSTRGFGVWSIVPPVRRASAATRTGS